MKLPKYRLGEPILPTESDAAKAEASSHALASYLENRQEGSCAIALIENDGNGKTIEIPELAMQLLLEILVHTAQGKPVKITPYTKELHTYQAAELLNVSDGYVWELLDAGKIPYKIVRNCRKIRYEDLIDYTNRRQAEQMKGLDELVAESQALGLYD